MTRHTVFRPVTITHVFAILTVKIDDAMQKKEVHESCDKMFRIWHEMGKSISHSTLQTLKDFLGIGVFSTFY